MGKITIKREGHAEGDLEGLVFIYKHPDISTILADNPLKIYKQSEGRYIVKSTGMEFKANLVETKLEEDKARISYSAELSKPSWLPSTSIFFQLEGKQEGDLVVSSGKATVSAGRLSIFLLNTILRPALDAVGDAVWSIGKKAGARIQEDPESCIKKLPPEKQKILKNYLKKKKKSQKAKHTATLSVTPVSEYSHIRFTTSVPRHRSYSDKVPSEEVNHNLSHSFNALIGLATRYGRGVEEDIQSDKKDKDFYGRMIKLGNKLYSEYLPEKVKSYLTSTLDHQEDKQIAVEAEGRDSNLPWEFLHNGDDFLCLLSPLIRVPAESASSSSKANLDKVLIFAPHQYKGEEDLPQVQKESRAIYEMLKEETDLDPHLLSGTDATKDTLFNQLEGGEFSCLHFSGHSKYDSDYPRSSCLLTSDGGKIMVDDLARLSKKTKLELVFLNSCLSGKGSLDEVTGLSASFVRNGVPAAIGNQFIISDRSAAELAKSFYQNLLNKYGYAESLRRARIRVGRFSNWEDPAWAAPVLYSDIR